jgi:virulence-associated protein VagC
MTSYLTFYPPVLVANRNFAVAQRAREFQIELENYRNELNNNNQQTEKVEIILNKSQLIFYPIAEEKDNADDDELPFADNHVRKYEDDQEYEEKKLRERLEKWNDEWQKMLSNKF